MKKTRETLTFFEPDLEQRFKSSGSVRECRRQYPSLNEFTLPVPTLCIREYN